MTQRRPVAIPAGSWPPRMMADMAAGYCGEKHVEDFLERVGRTYPAPWVVDTTRRKFWYRDDLDRAIKLGTTEALRAWEKSYVRRSGKSGSSKSKVQSVKAIVSRASNADSHKTRMPRGRLRRLHSAAQIGRETK
ncbi:hypothetical protein QA648_34025 (plasmid) [Rhizobium sp. CB3171]|uniref:hypothetical protein n=1 Tax=Rhizobium sp. CB3171 TaxID=3039157 RepID=UPI0024B1443E|nr:hypothetical protein [Rhizobium sp. CB3171]WFU06802.1 hypothetical protein QA648_34025 [Rhizobium sp. CB3171]